MAFIILGSVGSAIGAGLTAAGLGAAGGAISGAAAGLSGLLGSGLTAAGLGSAGAAASTAGATGAALGAGAGTAIGAPIGAVTGGIGSLMGGSGAAAGAATPSAALSGAASATGAQGALAGFSPGALAGAVPASSGTGIAGGTVFAGGSSAALPTAGSVFMGAAPSMVSEAGSFLGEEALKEGASEVLSERPQIAPRGGGGGRPQSPYDTEEQQRPRSSGNLFANPFGGFAEGGLTTLKGGGISMREGQYVVPADVVSAIGNGSSKAGAKFLEQAFNHYIQNGPPEGVKPQQRAGSLAEQRMKERVQREAA